MDTQKGSKTIQFKIDKKQYRITADQNPVTGSYLRGLPPVPEDYDLYLRARGHEDDTVILPDAIVTVKHEDHFYTSKRVINPGSI